MTGLPAHRPAGTTLTELDQWEADALAAIEAVDTPEAAEELLARVKLVDQARRLADRGAEREQRWGRVRLLAERRYGELLGPAEVTPPPAGGVSTGNAMDTAERLARSKARAVAAVPEPVFNNYVESEPQPTRAGLLREAGEKPADTMDRLKAAASSGDPDAERAVVEYRDSLVISNFAEAVRAPLAVVAARDNTLDAITRLERRRAEELLDRCEHAIEFIAVIRDGLANHLKARPRRLK